MIQRSRKMISSPWSYLIISFFSGRSWSPQSNGGHRHADKQLLRDDGSALTSMPRALKEAALHWVWGKIVREDEVEPSLERQGEFLWDPRRKNALYSNKKSGKGKGEGNRMTHLKNGKRWGFPHGSVLTNLPANAGDARDTGWIPGLGRSPGEGHGNPLQYSCLGNPMAREPGGLQSVGCKETDTTWWQSTQRGGMSAPQTLGRAGWEMEMERLAGTWSWRKHQEGLGFDPRVW